MAAIRLDVGNIITDDDDDNNGAQQLTANVVTGEWQTEPIDLESGTTTGAETTLARSLAEESNRQNTTGKLLPILIIPGFMSSGLVIKESKYKPEWVGERIWINLEALGFESLYVGDAAISDPEGDDMSGNDDNNNLQEDDNLMEQRKYKSQWMSHMVLDQDNMKAEHPGVKVRAIPGLEGVDYLTPGMLTNHVSYVFGPVISALQRGGYTPNVNLQAAPYDWRVCPMELERRDAYFTNTCNQIQKLYEINSNTPVVLLCHSLGTKTCHYLLNFALKTRGRNWLDTYVHTYMPVGAPHCGAPKAIRSVLTGDKMSLDAFLSDEEALRLGRSLGSGPWLFPGDLPPGVPASAYVKPQGVLQITVMETVNLSELVESRRAISRAKKYQLAFTMGHSARTKQEQCVITPFAPVIDEEGDLVSFSDYTIWMSTPPTPPGDGGECSYFQVILQEPGLGAAKLEYKVKQQGCNPVKCFCMCITCCWICELIYRILYFCIWLLSMFFIISADLVVGAVGDSLGTTLAHSPVIELNSHTKLWQMPNNAGMASAKPVIIELQLQHKDDVARKVCCWMFQPKPRTATIKLRVQWTPFPPDATLKAASDPRAFRQHLACSAVARPQNEQPVARIIHRSSRRSGTGIGGHGGNVLSREVSGNDALLREGLQHVQEVIREDYDNDPTTGPRTSSSLDAPPVRRIHSIYGTNLPTEIGAIYHRPDMCHVESRLQSRHALDLTATYTGSAGYQIKNGILYETKNTPQSVDGGRTCSGDGTVPYFSLQHVNNWKGQVEHVSVVELEEAEHRAILADQRLHKAILEYCTPHEEEVDA